MKIWVVVSFLRSMIVDDAMNGKENVSKPVNFQDIIGPFNSDEEADEAMKGYEEKVANLSNRPGYVYHFATFKADNVQHHRVQKLTDGALYKVTDSKGNFYFRRNILWTFENSGFREVTTNMLQKGNRVRCERLGEEGIVVESVVEVKRYWSIPGPGFLNPPTRIYLAEANFYQMSKLLTERGFPCSIYNGERDEGVEPDFVGILTTQFAVNYFKNSIKFKIQIYSEELPLEYDL